MSLRFARWQDGHWIINPFNLTCEQLKSLIKISNANEILVDEQHLTSVRYFYRYDWGHIFEEEMFKSDFHEIDISYGCPSGYNRNRQVAWLKAHNYPFEIEG